MAVALRSTHPAAKLLHLALAQPQACICSQRDPDALSSPTSHPLAPGPARACSSDPEPFLSLPARPLLPPVTPPARLPIRPPARLTDCSTVCLSLCLSICLPVCPSVRLPACLPVPHAPPNLRSPRHHRRRPGARPSSRSRSRSRSRSHSLTHSLTHSLSTYLSIYPSLARAALVTHLRPAQQYPAASPPGGTCPGIGDLFAESALPHPTLPPASGTPSRPWPKMESL